ncbi:MAG: Hsp70 family protein [Pseudomonadota bacterium]
MGRAIGIDLGTTNSCAAIIDGGKPRIITSPTGATTVPSIFAIDEQGRELVGQEAKRQAQLNPQHTVMGAKRLIGRNFHSKTIEKIRQVFTYELMEGESSEVLIKVNNQVFTLEQISAAILLRIKDFAEGALRENVEHAVITVPAYFNDRQRQAVRTAGRLAGLKVLRILNEPTAAALAYGLGRTLNQRVAVYDLGGGTFDISVIDIKDKVFEVIATGGDTVLGGVDFDGRVMQWLLERFHEKHRVDLSWDRVAIQRIRDAAESAKIELSTVAETRIHIPFITRGEEGPLDVDEILTREKLESLTRDLVERTLSTCERIFREAGTTLAQIDEMLLVGGQSRMPLVQKVVTDMIGKPPSKAVHPDEAVGIGAAIMAHSLAEQKGSHVTLLDVLPMPIGINKVDGTMHVLFHKNQPLPDYKTRTLTTSKDNQKSILLRIYQGESRRVEDNELLGTFVFSGIRAAPRGQVHIEVTFHIDSEGILNLSARDKTTGKSVASALKLGKRKDAPPRKRPATRPPTSKTPVAQAQEKPTPSSSGISMPTSSLAEAISGGASDPGSQPLKPKSPPEQDAEQDSLPSITPSLDQQIVDKPGEDVGASEPPAQPEEERAAGDVVTDSMRKDGAQGEKKAEPLDAAPAGAEAKPTEAKPAAQPAEKGQKNGLFGRVAGWFKSFFGS